MRNVSTIQSSVVASSNEESPPGCARKTMPCDNALGEIKKCLPFDFSLCLSPIRGHIQPKGNTMYRLPALLPILFSGLAFAEAGEVPQETVGMGGIIGFFVICAVMVAVFFWYTNKTSKMSEAERAGDKIDADKK
jgi:hypothetical protein